MILTLSISEAGATSLSTLRTVPKQEVFFGPCPTSPVPVVGFEIGPSITSWANCQMFQPEKRNIKKQMSVVMSYREMQECDVF